MMIAPSVLMVTTATLVKYKVDVIQDTFVISVRLLGVMRIKSVLLAITVPQVLYYQLVVQLHYIGQVLVLRMFHLVSLAKPAISALIMITYLEFVQEAISVLRKQKNQFHALLVLIILINDKELHHCACHVPQERLA